MWKLNTNASRVSFPPLTGVGLIIRDWEGNVKAASGLFADINFETHMAELWVIFEGLK